MRGMCSQTEADGGSILGQKIKLTKVVEGVTIEVIHGDVLSEKQDLISIQ